MQLISREGRPVAAVLLLAAWPVVRTVWIQLVVAAAARRAAASFACRQLVSWLGEGKQCGYLAGVE